MAVQPPIKLDNIQFRKIEDHLHSIAVALTKLAKAVEASNANDNRLRNLIVQQNIEAFKAEVKAEEETDGPA